MCQADVKRALKRARSSESDYADNENTDLNGETANGDRLNANLNRLRVSLIRCLNELRRNLEKWERKTSELEISIDIFDYVVNEMESEGVCCDEWKIKVDNDRKNVARSKESLERAKAYYLEHTRELERSW